MKSVVMIKETLCIGDPKFIIHVINVDDNVRGGWYRQKTSKEGMIERSIHRWHDFWHTKKYKSYKSQIRFSRWHDDDAEAHFNVRKRYIRLFGDAKAFQLYPEIVSVDHDSVWDFYDSINYDHRNKKVANTDTLILISER